MGALLRWFWGGANDRGFAAVAPPRAKAEDMDMAAEIELVMTVGFLVSE